MTADDLRALIAGPDNTWRDCMLAVLDAIERTPVLTAEDLLHVHERLDDLDARVTRLANAPAPVPVDLTPVRKELDQLRAAVDAVAAPAAVPDIAPPVPAAAPTAGARDQ